MTSNDTLSCTFHQDVITKATFRFKVWNLLENKDLVRFPRPCKGRIPNFVDSQIAAEKLTSLDIFKMAEVIKVNIDKPQESVRFSVLEERKTLLVPILKLADGVVTKICPPPDATKQCLKSASKRLGIDDFGKPIKLDEKIHIDLIVLGSVAVSKEGHRIGKGEGYSDLDYAVMAATGAVNQDTIVVTTVHDEQIFDTLPHDLFKPFDVPVDFIVTPTKVIEVTPRLPKPRGIIWNLLSDRRMQLVPLLKILRNKEIESGKDCTLKEVDSEPEERQRPYYHRTYLRRRLNFRPPRQDSRDSGATSPQPTRTFRRNNSRKQVDGSGDAQVTTNGPKSDQRGSKGERKLNGENKENQPQQMKPKPGRRYQRRFYKKKLAPDFSVKVGNIGATMRVRDLKAALSEKGVRPREITWKGARGFALLHFAKLNAEPEQPMAVDDVIASLQGLTVKSKNEAEIQQETLLSVEPAKRISRIEDAGVTSV